MNLKIKSITIFLLMISIISAITYNASSDSEIESYSVLLEIGDSLIIAPGIYNLNWSLSDISGTPENKICIIGYGAEINGTEYDNIINIYNVDYTVFEGLSLTHSHTGFGIDGIKVRTSMHGCEFKDITIHDITGTAFGANTTVPEFHDNIIRHCYIHDVNGYGEGIYIGTHDGSTEVLNCIIEKNLIHDCHDKKGIQLKRNSRNCIVQDNVVFNCDEAGIVTYKTDNPGTFNIIRRNAVWNCGEGIFAVGQMIIENNIVFNCPYGINTRNYSSWGMNDLYIVNNTVFNCSNRSIALSDWNTATSPMICCNNSVLTAQAGAYSIRATSGIGSSTVSHNAVYGLCDVSGQITTLAPSIEFANISPTAGTIDLYPTSSSTLRDSGIDSPGGHALESVDFNLSDRFMDGLIDIGAYEYSTSINPGWQIDEDYKDMSLAIVTDRVNFIEIPGFETFPNPFNSHIHLVFDKSITSIKITDISGKVIENIKFSKSATAYDWIPNNIESGIYFIITRNNGKAIKSESVVYIK